MDIRQGYEKCQRHDAWKYAVSLSVKVVGRLVKLDGVEHRVDHPAVLSRMTPTGRIAVYVWDLLGNDVIGMALLDALGRAEENPEEEMSFWSYANSIHVAKLPIGVREDLQQWVLTRDAREAMKNAPARQGQDNSAPTLAGFLNRTASMSDGMSAPSSALSGSTSNRNSDSQSDGSSKSWSPF